MAALFFAFNQPHYQKLIMQHLSDLLVMPREILRHLGAGKFVAILTGRPGHHVAIYEVHVIKSYNPPKHREHEQAITMHRSQDQNDHYSAETANESQPRERKEPQQTINQLSEQKSVQNIISSHAWKR